jgi:hypothetical protein
MNYPVMELEEADGTTRDYYRVEVSGAAVLLIPKDSADADPCLIPREIESLLKGSAQ